MSMQWYKIAFECPECLVSASLQKVQYSADGEFNFTFRCKKCKEKLQWRIYASQLLNEALMKDVVESQKVIPKSLPAPIEKITEKDKEFLRKLKISPIE